MGSATFVFPLVALQLRAVGIGANRACPGRSTVSRPGICGVLRLLAVALTTAMVAALRPGACGRRQTFIIRKQQTK